MVGLGGLEPPTSRLSGAHSNQLSYRPFFEGLILGVEFNKSNNKSLSYKKRL